MYASFMVWEVAGINPYLGLLVVVPAAFTIGYFLHRWLISRSLSTPEDSQILFSIGLLIAFQYLAQFFFSIDARSLTEESLQHSVIIGPIFLHYTQIDRKRVV